MSSGWAPTTRARSISVSGLGTGVSRRLRCQRPGYARGTSTHAVRRRPTPAAARGAPPGRRRAAAVGSEGMSTLFDDLPEVPVLGGVQPRHPAAAARRPRRRDPARRTSTPPSARPSRTRGRRCSWSPARARARPASWPTGSPTCWPPAASARARCWPSPSPTRPQPRCASGSRRWSAPGPGTMWVSTFHSAAVRILRYESSRLGLRSGFSIYDAADTQRLVGITVRRPRPGPQALPGPRAGRRGSPRSRTSSSTPTPTPRRWPTAPPTSSSCSTSTAATPAGCARPTPWTSTT